MTCLISDFLYTVNPDGTNQALPKEPVYAGPSLVPFFWKDSGGTFRELQYDPREPVTVSAADGSWSLVLPWPSESNPNTVSWQITLPDGTAWSGTVPEGQAGPLSIYTLKNTYSWVAVAAPSSANASLYPAAHAPTHLPAGSDPIDWAGTIHRAGTHTGRPAAAASNAGTLYFETDTYGLYRSDGASWTQVASLGPAKWFDVTAYGAKGDGSTDDTTAIANAKTAATAVGGILYFPPGTYITTTLTLSGAVTVTGTVGSILKLKNGSNADLLVVTAAGCILQGGMTFDGNKANNTAGVGIHSSQKVSIRDITVQNTANFSEITRCTVNGTGTGSSVAEGIFCTASDCLIAHNTVTATANHNIVSTQGSRNRIVGNRCDGAGTSFSSGFAHGITIDGNGGSNPNSGHVVANNMIANSWHDGIQIADGVNSTEISGNTIQNSGTGHHASQGRGIYWGGGLAVSSRVAITGNMVDTTYHDGILCEAPNSGAHVSAIVVSGNHVYNAQGHGIYLHWCDDATVTGNAAINNSQASLNGFSGIFVNASAHITVTGNRSYGGNQQYGVNVQSSTDTCLVTGNFVMNNATAGCNGRSSTAVFKHNQGYNPVGGSLQPAVPASNTSVTNNTGVDVQVIVATNSAGTQILINGQNVANLPSGTSYSYHLPAGQTAGFVYSGAAPTWVWIGE